MNVALFASAFYPSLGGVEELTRQLAHHYRQRGMGVLVLTNRWPRNLPEYETYEGIPLYRFLYRAPGENLKQNIKYLLEHKRIQRELFAMLRKHQIDMLHIQCVSINGYYALLAKKELGLPLVVTTQGERTMDATGIYQRSAFLNQVMRNLLLEGDYITGCSRDTLDDVIRHYGVSVGHKSEVVYNGIALSDFEGVAPYVHSRPYLLGIGRMVPQKGFDLLIEAFAQASLAEYDLLLAGDGPERNALEQQARATGKADRIHFTGRANRPEAVALFKGCAWFILPSRQEPLGIVNLEAMAAGKAVLAARTGGVPEIVTEGETGLLFPPGDVSALREGLVRLAQDADLRRHLGARGQERARQFDWNQIAESYCRIYAQVARPGAMP
jgi:glycosyltransferase involved in cell wall biosynthesis